MCSSRKFMGNTLGWHIIITFEVMENFRPNNFILEDNFTHFIL